MTRLGKVAWSIFSRWFRVGGTAGVILIVAREYGLAPQSGTPEGRAIVLAIILGATVVAVVEELFAHGETPTGRPDA